MDEEIHKRRVHYNGTHPVKFAEKYKELEPEKYSGIAEHVIGKGLTPAGTHIPIMVDEVMDFLQIQPGQCGYDATLGYGGHSEEILRRLNGKGHLFATDVDSKESEKTKTRINELGYGDDVFTVRIMNFSEAESIAAETGGFDFVLADLGISSMQLDNPERGFSYKTDGPLDLRMDQQAGEPASTRLAGMTEEEIIGMLSDNADEPYAEEIAHEIIQSRKHGREIKTTRDLHITVEKALKFLPKAEQKEAEKKSSARVFQALRIDVNGEYEALYAFLEKLPGILKPGGRAAILTFHSGEDRFVKSSFKDHFRQGLYSEIAQDVIRASSEECMRNSRARSAKLRWAVRSI